MDVVVSNKLNQLLSEWPTGQVYTTTCLRQKGYSDQQLKNYLKANWVKRIGVGAYKKTNDHVEWSAGLSAIQKQLRLPIHIGGKSALSLLGKGQYLQLGKITLALYGPSRTYLPTWFKRYAWSAKITYQQSNLVNESRESFLNKELGYTTKEIENHEVVMSSAERAILEYLDTLPSQGNYLEAFELMENLPSLRPQLLQRLLENCNSLKVKRLFFHLAEKVNHQWFSKLQAGKINFGIGKRVIFKGGRLDSKYQITIPIEAYEKQSV